MQPKIRSIHFITVALLIVSLILSPAPPTMAQSDDGLKRDVNAETGKLSFIGSVTGESVSIMQSLGLATVDVAADPARAFVQKYGMEFGLRDPATELTEVHELPRGDGRLNVRYQQTYQGIPVLGGELIVNTNEVGELYSISGEVSQLLSLSTEPSVARENAQSTALRMMAKYYGGAAADYVSSDPELWVFDDSLVGPSTRPVTLVWRMNVTALDGPQPIRQLVLIDAQTGKIALTFNQVDTIWHAGSNASTTKPAGRSAPLFDYPTPTEPFGAARITKDANNNTTAADDSILCSNQSLNCTGGTDPDADAAHLNAGLLWALYDAKHARNSINGAGMSITSIVHYDSGYANAFWNNNVMSYGDGYGFANADDVIAHELTHGVTEYESSLLYYYQSGAINESLSDLWGEYFDQTNGRGIDTNAVKWLIGEDITDLGVVRSMSNPPAFGDPDSMVSAKYYKGEDDNGGIHTNSGVNNKAVYLMVNGGSFGGKTVQPLGWDKTAAIYYEAQTNLLGTGANYSDLYYAVQQACRTLMGGLQGVTLDDCLNVTNALDAVKMNTPINLKHQITAPLCPAGQVPNSTPLFEDEMEGLLTTNWNVTPLWFTSTHIASSPTHSAFGDPNSAGYNDETMTMKNTVLIQPNTYVHFAHAYDFDYNGTQYYDGAVLEYSKDGGTTWIDAGTLFSAGAKYGGLLSGSNPIAGRQAFVGSSYSYYSYYYEYNPPFEPVQEISMVSSRFNLSSLNGQNIKLRFRFTTDEWLEFIGWHIDDVQIYTCMGAPAAPALRLPANGSLVRDYTPLLDWADSTLLSAQYHLQVSTDPTFATTLYDEPNLASSLFQISSDLVANTKYYWRVRALTSDYGTNWSTVWNFRTVFLPPELASPLDDSSQLTLRPTFTWTNPNPGLAPTSYTIQFSANSNFSPLVHTGTSATMSYTPSADLPPGELHWRVRANGANGPSDFSDDRSFHTPVSAPAIPTLTSPATGVLLTNYQPTFMWTVPLGTSVDHFNIQIDNNSNFSSPEINQSTGSATPGFTPVSALPNNVVLYWRVQTVNGSGVMGAWSTARNVRMAIAPPANLSPADDALANSLRPTFNWDDVPQAAGYTIQFSVNPTFSPLLHSGNPAVSQYVPTINLPMGATIYWRVRTRGLVGPSAFTPLSSEDATVNIPAVVPAVPTLTAPGSGALTTDYSPELYWTMPLTSPPFDHFIVQIDNNADFSSPEEEDIAVASSPFVPTPDLVSNTRFYWRVRAVNGTIMGNWSTMRSFRTALVPPSNLSPADNTPVIELRPLFNWDDVLYATGYNIQFSLYSSFSPVLHTGNPVTSQYVPTVDLPKGATVYWRVRSSGTNGPSAFTPAIPDDRTITTPAAVPGVPTLSAPASNFLTKDYTPTFTWTMPATSSAYNRFYFQIDNDVNFSSPVVDIQDGSIIIPSYTAVTNLASNTRFYWRVRAVNGTIMGNWSAARYFRTALEVPLLLSPANGSHPEQAGFIYNWSDVPGAAGYNIQISPTDTFTHILTNATTVYSVYAPVTSYCGSTLYWRVRANGTNGPGDWSITFSFTAPACPSP